MPPEGGYDHPPMGGDMMMPPPMNMDIAMMGPNDTLESMGMNPDGSGGAYESGTMDMGAMGDGGGMGAMADAMGGAPVIGDEGFVEAAPVDAMDAAVGSAMDSAMDQGGPAVPVIGDEGFVEAAPVAAEAPVDDVDPSAGMG
jgi:hypothetical protein